MLKNNKGNRIYFNSVLFNELVTKKAAREKKTKKLIFTEIYESITKLDQGEKHHIDLDTIVRWSKTYKKGEKAGKPYAQPGKIEYVEIIANYLGVDIDELTYELPEKENNDAETEFELSNTSIEGTANQNESFENQFSEAREQIKNALFVRIFLDYFFLYYFGLTLNPYDRFMLMHGSGISDDYKMALCNLADRLSAPHTIKPFSEECSIGTLFVKKKLRKKMRFLGLRYIAIVLLVVHRYGFKMRKFDYLLVIFGLKVWSPEMKYALARELSLLEQNILQFELPIKNYENERLFHYLTYAEAEAKIEKAEPVILGDSYLKNKKFEYQKKITKKKAKKLNIYIPFWGRYCVMSDFRKLHDICRVIRQKDPDAALIMFNDYFMGDELLKSHIKTYTVENGIDIFFIKSEA